MSKGQIFKMHHNFFTNSHMEFTQKWFGPLDQFEGNSLFTAPFSLLKSGVIFEPHFIACDVSIKEKGFFWKHFHSNTIITILVIILIRECSTSFQNSTQYIIATLSVH